MELGKYSDAADAYQTMVRLRPDMSSYNRAAYYRFVAGDAAGAIEIMKKAIEAGSRSPENIAWCLADLGNMDLKTGASKRPEQAFQAALKFFPAIIRLTPDSAACTRSSGKTTEAIEQFTKAPKAVPLPEYAAALEDLYQAAGKPEEARETGRAADRHRENGPGRGLPRESQSRAGVRRSRPQPGSRAGHGARRDEIAARRLRARCAGLGAVPEQAIRRGERGQRPRRSNWARRSRHSTITPA